MRNIDQKPRSSWVAIVSFGILAATLVAQADTYNFFFSKDKKKKDASTEQPSPEQSAEAPEESPEEKSTKPFGASAIEIHNHNTNTNNVPVETAKPMETNTLPPPAQPIAGSVAVAAPVKDSTKHSPFRLGVGLAYVFADSESGYLSNGVPQTYTTREGGESLITEFGFDITRSFGVNLLGGVWKQPTTYDSYLGQEHETRWVWGAEMQFLPIRAGARDRYDIFELGLVGGGSNIMASANNLFSAHAGIRMNVNFSNTFGMTLRGRGNAGYVMTELGMIFRL